MADRPTPHPSGKPPKFNETAIAICAALVLSMVLSWVLVGSPMRATRMAYIDYSHTPAMGARDASEVDAPLTQSEVKAVEEGKKPANIKKPANMQ